MIAAKIDCSHSVNQSRVNQELQPTRDPPPHQRPGRRRLLHADLEGPCTGGSAEANPEESLVSLLYVSAHSHRRGRLGEYPVSVEKPGSAWSLSFPSESIRTVRLPLGHVQFLEGRLRRTRYFLHEIRRSFGTARSTPVAFSLDQGRIYSGRDRSFGRRLHERI